MRTTTGRMTLFGLLLVLAACVAASSGQASTGVRYGIQDDAWLEFGPGTLNQRLATFERLGVPLVRFNLRWNAIARRRPTHPTSPRDPAYDWRRADRVLRGLRRYGLTPVLTLVGTPAWANGGRAPNFAPPRPRDFRRFATAAARRYPWVRYWLIWNEPNKRLWLRPTRSAIYVQHLLNPAYEAIHAVLPHARVGGGATGPKGAAGGVAPVTWVRGMAAAHAKFDAYAHHPYPSTPSETPSSGGCRNCPWITMATIRKLLILVKRSFGSKPIWLTEYGYQTNPPTVPRRASEAAGDESQPRRDEGVEASTGHDADPVPLPRRALAQPLPDRPRVRGRSLEALAAGIRAALCADGARGLQAIVWGQVRDGRPGRKWYRLEVLRRNVWKPVGRVRLTNDDGVFMRTVRIKPGALFRIWSPRQRRFSLQLRIR